MNNFLSSLDFSFLQEFALIALKVLGVMILGWVLSRSFGRFVNQRLSNEKGVQLDDTFRPLVVRVVRYGIFLCALYAALQIAGIPAASLLAVMGAAGLAIALAVQGTLANIASGLMILFLRILRVGDYIQTPDCEGTVEDIGLFTTWVRSSAGVLQSLPNANLWAKPVTNFSRTKTRRLDISLSVSRDNDLDHALEILQNTVSQSQHKIIDKDVSVIVSDIQNHQAILQIRFWVEASSARLDGSGMRAELQAALRKHKIKLPPVAALSMTK